MADTASLLNLADGFLALPRRLCASTFFDSLRADERFIVVTILLRARWAPGEFFFGGHRFPLAPGQLIDSEEAIATAAGSTRKIVRTVIRKMSGAGLLTRAKAHPAGQCPHVTTILGYERILPGKPSSGPPVGQPLGHEGASEGPANGPLTGQEGAPCNKENQGNRGNKGNPGDKEKQKASSPSSPEVDEVLQLWNALPGLPKSRGGTKVRGAIASRLREPGWLEAYREALRFVANSDFHRGDNDRKWMATLEWVLKPGKAEELADKATARPQRRVSKEEEELIRARDQWDRGCMPDGTPYVKWLQAQRAPGENPKPGDPDFNDPSAWRDPEKFRLRTDGRTWEQVTGLKRPVYKPPLTPEERAELEAKKRVADAPLVLGPDVPFPDDDAGQELDPR